MNHITDDPIATKVSVSQKECLTTLQNKPIIKKEREAEIQKKIVPLQTGICQCSEVIIALEWNNLVLE